MVGRDFDTAVCNFSLFADEIRPLLEAIRRVTRGHLVIQTVHPLSDTQTGGYQDGWREETYTGLPGRMDAHAVVLSHLRLLGAGAAASRLDSPRLRRARSFRQPPSCLSHLGRCRRRSLTWFEGDRLTVEAWICWLAAPPELPAMSPG